MYKELLQNPIFIVLIYIVVSFIGILLHDLKYLFFLKSDNKIKAVIICGIYTLFNTTTTLFIAKQSLMVSLPVIAITNMISMWIAMTYSEKTMKVFIYKYEITTKNLDTRFQLKDIFKEKNIPYLYTYAFYENNKDETGIEMNEFGETMYHRYEIYAFTKKHSKQLEEILNKYDQKDLKWIKTDTGYYK